MNIAVKDEYRLKDRIALVRRVNYYSSAFAILFGLICLLFLDITRVIPFVFIGFGILNLINTWAFKKHGNLIITYNITSVLALSSALLITLYSGGIHSPFIFVLALIVFAGYITTRVYGKIYLYLNLLLVTLLFLHSTTNFEFGENVVPEHSRNLFAYLSILFSVYLLGGVFGKNLLRAQHNLYKSRNEIEQRITEKETLLKEIHHRVKNNLQTVSSLLSLQSRNIDNRKVKELIKSSQNRVIAMAMIHEMLYMREDLTKVAYKSYVQELAEHLIRSVKGTSSNITLKMDIPDIVLNIDTAIPLGLLINETISNALKYGIRDERKGEITISLKTVGDSEYELYIGDDGVGFPDQINHKTSKSLGLKLIHNLARQLQGSIKRDKSRTQGTHYIVRFREIGESLHSVA